MRHIDVDADLDEGICWWHPFEDAILVRSREGILWIVPLHQAEPTRLDAAPAAVQAPFGGTSFWSPDGVSCMTVGPFGEGRGFVRVPLDGSHATALWTSKEWVEARHYAPVMGSMGDVSADGSTVVFAAHDTTHPPDLWVSIGLRSPAPADAAQSASQ